MKTLELCWNFVFFTKAGPVSNGITDIVNVMQGTREPVILDEHSAPALMQWTEQHAQHIGLKTPPAIIYFDNKLPSAAAGVMPADAEGAAIPFISLSAGELKLHDMPNLRAGLPTSIKATLSHEMSHLKDMTTGVDSFALRILPVFALPIISLIGYELYTRSRKRHQDDPSKTALEHLGDIANEKAAHKDWHKPMLEWGKRLAVLSLGAVAGAMVTRHISLAAEFRADRAAVIASGYNPQIYIDTLEKSEKMFMEIFAPQFNEWRHGMKDRGFWKNVEDIYGAIKHDLVGMTLTAHPSHAARAKAMREFAAKHVPGL